MTIRVRSISAILSALLLAGPSANAAPVTIHESIQVFGSYQNPPKLRLRRVFQYSGEALFNEDGSAQRSSGVNHTVGKGSADPTNPTVGQAEQDSTESLLSGIAVGQDKPPAAISVIDQGNLEGTICDCGEITVPVGGLPKWPLLFVAAIPFFFIHGSSTLPPTVTATPTPTPIPPPTTPTIPQVPEPASLILFGLGLVALAGFRHRRASAKRAE